MLVVVSAVAVVFVVVGCFLLPCLSFLLLFAAFL